MSVRERIQDLLVKAQGTGISPDERQELDRLQAVRQSPEVARIQAERIWQTFFFRHAEISDTQANRKALFERGLSLSSDDRVQLEHLEEAAKLLAAEGSIKPKRIPTAADRKRQEAQDKETFQQAAIQLGFSANTANEKLVETLGPGFTIQDIAKAISSNRLQLAPVGSEEQEQRDEQERADLIEELVADRYHPWTQETGLDPNFYAQKEQEIQQFHRDKFLGYTTERLRNAASDVRERRKFGQMTPTEIRRYLRDTRPAPKRNTDLDMMSADNILLSMQAAGEDKVKATGDESTRAAGETDYLRRLCQVHGWKAVEQKFGRVNPRIGGIVKTLQHEFDARN